MGRKFIVLTLVLFLVMLNFQLSQAVPVKNVPAKSSNLAPKVQPIIKKVDEKPPIISLSNHIRSYQRAYTNVFIATLAALSNSIIINSYDSSKGEIKAKLRNGKELFILVVAPQNNLSVVRITPADGIYDIPISSINEMFEDIRLELSKS